LNPNVSGISLLWNDEQLIVEEYKLNKKIYYCGKELLKFRQDKSLVYCILSVDYDEVAYAEIYSDGEIKIIWHETSCIPKKMKPGGQSAHRFAQNRENEITAWFKKIDRFLMSKNEQVYLDMSDVYYKRFYNTLHTYNQAKIRMRTHTSYSGITGIYQMVAKCGDFENRRQN